MNAKIKECFKPHVMMHSLFGLGLGIVLVSLIPGLNNIWLGVGAIVLSTILDSARKS